MSNEKHVKHSMAAIIQNENHWRQSLTHTTDESSGDLAQRNLERLHSLQQTLRGQLTSLDVRRQQVMDKAVADGTVTDYMRDGVCEQLVAEGWLQRAEPLPHAHIRPTNPLYLLTEIGSEAWKPAETEEVLPS